MSDNVIWVRWKGAKKWHILRDKSRGESVAVCGCQVFWCSKSTEVLRPPRKPPFGDEQCKSCLKSLDIAVATGEYDELLAEEHGRLEVGDLLSTVMIQQQGIKIGPGPVIEGWHDQDDAFFDRVYGEFADVAEIPLDELRGYLNTGKEITVAELSRILDCHDYKLKVTACLCDHPKGVIPDDVR